MCSSDAGSARRLVSGKPDLVCVITKTSCFVEIQQETVEGRSSDSLKARGFGWRNRGGGPRDTLHSSFGISASTIGLCRKNKMADKQQPPRYVALYRQANDLAMGEHPLSKYVPPLLLLADALLTSLIISKVACKLLLF